MQCKSGYAQAGKTKRDGQMPVSRGMAWENYLFSSGFLITVTLRQ